MSLIKLIFNPIILKLRDIGTACKVNCILRIGSSASDVACTLLEMCMTDYDQTQYFSPVQILNTVGLLNVL